MEGRLEDASGKPVPGISVSLAGYEKAVVTGEDGRFAFPVAGERSALTFSAGDEKPNGCLLQTALNSTLNRDGQPKTAGFGTFKLPCVLEKTPEGEAVFVSLDGRWLYGSDGTLRDNTNKLMWQVEASDHKVTWFKAVRYCEDLSLAGHDDWQLPDSEILAGLLRPAESSANHPFIERAKVRYWSATMQAESKSNAVAVSDSDGAAVVAYGSDPYLARCVRKF